MGNFFDYELTHWFNSAALQQLDDAFLNELKLLDQSLHQNLLNYRAGKFKDARKHLSDCRLHSEYPLDKAYDVYEERIEDLLKNPPGEEWDGVFTATSK